MRTFLRLFSLVLVKNTYSLEEEYAILVDKLVLPTFRSALKIEIKWYNCHEQDTRGSPKNSLNELYHFICCLPVQKSF